jgi:hypothetical protein
MTENSNLDSAILAKLQELWEDSTGLDPEDLQLQPETTLAEMMQAYRGESWLFTCFDEDLNLDDLCFRIAKEFSLVVHRDEWISLFGGIWEVNQQKEWEQFQQQFTVQDLMEFIQKPKVRIQFDSVNICGNYCAPAGAFFGIREVVNSLKPHCANFGPSTPLQNIFKTCELNILLKKLSRLSNTNLPLVTEKIPSPILLLVLFISSVFSLAAAFGTATSMTHEIWPVMFILFTAVSAAIFLGGIQGFFNRNPFGYRVPENIQTFRDLAEFIAKSRELT